MFSHSVLGFNPGTKHAFCWPIGQLPCDSLETCPGCVPSIQSLDAAVEAN